MYRKATAVLFFAMVLPGCAQQRQVVTPQLVVTKMENNVYQFQHDTGTPLDMGTFMLFLDEWLKQHPELVVKSVVPQITVYQTQHGGMVNSVGGVLVFTSLDSSKLSKPEEKK